MTFLLHVSAFADHPLGGHLQRNTIITNVFKDVCVCVCVCGVKIQRYHLKYCSNVL
jgi:hypothetical protein